MKFAAQNLAVLLVTAALGMTPQSAAAGAPPAFGSEKTSWHGFDRYDFLMDEADLSIKPYKAPPDEDTAANTTVKGQLRCVVVAPKEAAPGNPWSWRGYYFDHEPQAEIELLRRGFHIGFVGCDAGKPWDAWYAFLTEQQGLSRKPAFIGMSRGGRNAYTWATAHPDQVSCVYADNPAVSRDALALLGGLARNDVPLLHVCGSLDPLLGNHTLVVESVYQQLGGRISVLIKDGAAHHPHSLRDPKPIADFIEQSLRPAGGEPPALVGKVFTKTSFYGTESDYRDLPSEKTFAACRGPWFAPSYDRYEFRIDGVPMPVSVIVPKAAAPGKPWVFRADFVTRDAAVDLALLGKGFHVVTGPVPTDTDGPVLQQWNAVYQHLTDHGLSKTPVLEGAGGAAGEAYAWAIENPDKVSCVYAENPILRSHMTKAQPLDRLDVLAKTGVPLLHVCGGRDPWLDTQTRVLEKRYKELGGQVTVVIQEGAGHFPTAPKDPKPVVEFIARRQTAQAAEPKPLPAAALAANNQPKLVIPAGGSGRLVRVEYPPSTAADGLQVGVTCTLWLPDGVARLRGVIVHQHGAGTTAAREGATAAYDLHWQALARKWDCALLGPSYHVLNEKIDLSPGGSELWFDPRHGSGKSFLKALGDLAAASSHPELETVPWVLWGHSGGGIWCDVMTTLHPERVVAVWLRSGSAAMFRTHPEFAQPQVPAAVHAIPFMANTGVKEKPTTPGVQGQEKGPWYGNLATFREYRAKGGLIGFAPDPRTGHECGDSRYLAIPFFDACLAARLPDRGANDQTLKPMDQGRAWLAPLLGAEAKPVAEFRGDPREAVWLPNAAVARAWMEYVKTGAVGDATPPPAPTDVRVTRTGDLGAEITWRAAADLESGIGGFVVLRDGQELARLPQTPVGKFGRPLFQGMTYHDTPDQPLPEMRYRDAGALPGEKHAYAVITVNGVGLKSEPATESPREGGANPPPRSYRFDGTMPREVLGNNLARAISMEGLLNGRGDLDDNVRMLRATGARFVGRSLCLWGGEANLLRNLERAKRLILRVHAADPDMILQACVFEVVTRQVEQVPVPDWAFTALGRPVERRHFRYADMLYPDGRGGNRWGRDASVPDVSRPETKLWFYFLAASYIDLGIEAIHFGQAEIMSGNDPDLAHWSEVLGLVRSYAARHARRHLVLCDAHVPSGGLVRDGKLLLDFHSFPLRIKEVPDKPQEAVLEVGFADAIYRRSKGGVTPSGWACDHLPYLVELDNWGVSKQPGEARAGGIWVWGYDEITWFAHQSREYRASWLNYAHDWVRRTDPNGFLQMPGSRTLRSPRDGKQWYHANAPSPSVPDGLGDEEAIRSLWAGEAGGG